MEGAVDAVRDFVAAGARAVELMDVTTVKMSANRAEAPASWASVPDGTAALLVEFRAPNHDELGELQRQAQAITDGLELVETAAFTSDDELAAFYWWVRSSLMAAGASRSPGSTLIVEDVCVRPEHMAAACRAVAELQVRFRYPAGVAGHASAGNLHFMLDLDAGSDVDRSRYQDFMDDLADLIVTRFDGSLKAEHGTGRNMSPYLEFEWGRDAVDAMWAIKDLADPHGVLAPGVMLNRDKHANMAHLKTMPTIEKVADACFECGFCEQACPSRHLTTTPRQRIALRREMERHSSNSSVLGELMEQFEYGAVETCAGDSTCSTACPIGIDTGALMKDFRVASNGRLASRVASVLARRWAQVEVLARLTLRFGGMLGDRAMKMLTGAARHLASDEIVPSWIDAMPAAAPALPQTSRSAACAVYLPACINRIFGPSRKNDGLHVVAALVEISERAGQPVWIPDDVAGTCCATVWHSKGFTDANTVAARQLVDDLWRWTNRGTLPVVIDATSCTMGAAREIVSYLDEDRRARHQRLTILDSVSWTSQYLLPHLSVAQPLPSLTVHPTCAVRNLGLSADLGAVAEAIAERVHVPASTTCCGFAGDRGFLHPELAASATQAEAAEVRRAGTAAVVSSNRTCEVGLEQATGLPYESIVIATARATRPRPRV